MAVLPREVRTAFVIAVIAVLCPAAVALGTERDAPASGDLAGRAAGSSSAATGTASSTRAGTASTGVVADVPSLRELVGQRFVVAMRGTSPSPALLRRVRRGEIGGVILFGGNIVDRPQLRRLVARLQGAAREAGRPPLLVAVDQEGGKVRRIPWAGPVRTTADLGRLTPSAIRARATEAANELRRAGINVDLAPVADVPRPGSFMELEERTFAARPAVVAAAAAAFAQGLATAGVAPVVKHFPGIGRARRNTDRAAVEIAAPGAELARTDLLPFRSAIAAGAPIVMLSNATYPSLDDRPAAWSMRIQALLRRELGFGGVTITDALDGAAATRERKLSSVAALAAQAGVDLLLLTGTEASSSVAFERVARLARDGRIPLSRLEASYRRILALKETYG